MVEKIRGFITEGGQVFEDETIAKRAEAAEKLKAYMQLNPIFGRTDGESCAIFADDLVNWAAENKEGIDLFLQALGLEY